MREEWFQLHTVGTTVNESVDYMLHQQMAPNSKLLYFTETTLNHFFIDKFYYYN